jgi:hypothetical protein
LGRLEVLERPFDAGFLLRDWLPDDRLEDPEAFAAGREPDFEVPLLRDAGGEDVRVAMVRNLRDGHTSHMLHTPQRPGDRPVRVIELGEITARASAELVGERTRSPYSTFVDANPGSGTPDYETRRGLDRLDHRRGGRLRPRRRPG